MTQTALETIPLLDLLSIRFPNLSKNSLKEFIQQGRILSDGYQLTKTSLVDEDIKIELAPKKIFRDGYTIYFEDAHIIVIEKPVGLLSVSTETEVYHTLHSKVKMWHKKAWPVHRLDRETSGVLVFALSEEAKEGLKTQFIRHTIYREYFAIVKGHLEGSGTWKTPLYEDKTYYVHIGSEGDEIGITHYEALYRKGNQTAIKCVLETGKKNQIRVQAAHFGHPVMGDKKYGGTGVSFERLLLHAHKLHFTHPVTDKKMSFLSPKPFR